MVINQSFMPIVEVTRGIQVESAHRGAIAVVDSEGRLVASLGNPSQPIFVRSCSKPIQALALICSGAADAFGLTEEELTLVCASHSGEAEHVALVRSLMAKAGVEANWLRCGIHPPFDAQARRMLAASGEEPSALHNNCSGKHAGMLATARYLGLSTSDYIDPEHGVQVAIRSLLAYLGGLEPDEIGVAVDGCTAPTFYLPLRSFSLAMARLAAVGENVGTFPVLPEEAFHEEADSDGFPVPVSVALARIWKAMKNHPVLVAGSRGRLCTDLMKVARAFGVALVAKSGAEGGYAMAVAHRGRAVGITLKVEDGSQRARDAAALETLFQLELLPEEARGSLAGYHRQIVLDRRDEPVGEVRPRFRLSRGLPG